MDGRADDGNEPPNLRRFRVALGGGLLVHAAASFVLLAAMRRSYEVLWLCHVAEWSLAVGLLRRWKAAVATATAAVLTIQLAWAADALVWLATGRFPLGMSALLQGARGADWIVAAAHFFAAPLSAAFVARAGWARRDAWLFAAAAYAALIGVSRACTPPDADVNAAFRPVAGMEGTVLADLHYLGDAYYLPGLVVAAAVFAFWPGNLLLGALQRSLARPPRSNPPPAARS